MGQVMGRLLDYGAGIAQIMRREKFYPETTSTPAECGGWISATDGRSQHCRTLPTGGRGGDSGSAYVLVTSDYFTRWVEAYAIPNQEAVRQVGRGILYYHSSSTLTMGINLNPMSFKTFASCCTLTYATPYHPNQMDWSSRSIAYSSPCLQRVYEHPWSCDKHLKSECMVYNTSVRPTTGDLIWLHNAVVPKGSCTVHGPDHTKL